MNEKTLWASDIMKKPELIKDLTEPYVLICDRTMTGGLFDNLIRAINLMAKEGWDCISISSSGTTVSLYALMKKVKQ